MGCVARSSLHPGIGGAAAAHTRPAYATATAHATHATDAAAHAAAAAATAAAVRCGAHVLTQWPLRPAANGVALVELLRAAQRRCVHARHVRRARRPVAFRCRCER